MRRSHRTLLKLIGRELNPRMDGRYRNGYAQLARALGIPDDTVRSWALRNRVPRTQWRRLAALSRKVKVADFAPPPRPQLTHPQLRSKT